MSIIALPSKKISKILVASTSTPTSCSPAKIVAVSLRRVLCTSKARRVIGVGRRVSIAIGRA